MSTPLSSSQLNIYLDQFTTPDEPNYNIGGYVEIKGTLDLPKFQQAFTKIMTEHDVFNLIFKQQDNEIVQIPQDYQHNLVFKYASSLDNIMTDIQSMMRTPFDLTRLPLYESGVIQHTDNHHFFYIIVHHLIIDGWSYSLFTRKLFSYYEALANAEQLDDSMPTPSYLALVDKLNHNDGDKKERNLNFWQETLDLSQPPLFEQRVCSPESQKRKPNLRHTISLPKQQYFALKHELEHHKLGMHHYFIGLLQLYFSQVCDQESIVLGLPSHNRRGALQKQTLGCFSSVGLGKFTTDQHASLLENLQLIAQQWRKFQRHNQFPLNELYNRLNSEQKKPRSLFEIEFNYQMLDYNFDCASVETYVQAMATGYEKSPLAITVCEYDQYNDIDVHLDFNLAYFTPFRAENIKASLTHLYHTCRLENVAPVRELTIIADNELASLRADEQGLTISEGQSQHSLVQFMAKVAAQPNQVAISYKDSTLTYQALADLMASYVHQLQQIAVKPNARIAIMFDRTPNMVAAMLATWAVGATYVPLDKQYPINRLSYILSDANVDIILCDDRQHTLFETLPTGVNVLQLSIGEEQAVLPDFQTLPLSTPSHLIYTSGSTGKPKGVEITHENIAALSIWAQNTYSTEELSGVIASTSVCFDLSIFEIFVTLNLGGRLILVENGLAQHAITNAKQPTLLNTVPSVLNELLSQTSLPATIQTVNLAGEALPKALASRLYELPHIQRVYNLYGPSEDTTYSTASLVQRDSTAPITIGKPIHGTQAFVLNAKGQRLPFEVKGELYLSGKGIANGYINRPTETAEKFSLSQIDHKALTLYKTGDLVSRTAQGELIYHGRTDQQIKINGLRIEPGEIEYQLTQVPTVTAGKVVCASQTGKSTLVAFVQSDEPDEQLIPAIKAHLLETLPHAWLPDKIVPLTAFPTLPNGKTDGNALLDLVENTAICVEKPRELASTETEKQLSAMWEAALSVEACDIHTHFFELGGNSLQAMRILSKIEDEFSIELTLHQLLNMPTISQLAQHIDNETPQFDAELLELIGNLSEDDLAELASTL